jgi:hypothetical protein
VRNAIDLKDGGQSLTTNDEMMNLVQSLDGGNAWAVGRFDVLASQARLPGGLAAQLPPITWFAASGYVNDGLSGVLAGLMLLLAGLNDTVLYWFV